MINFIDFVELIENKLSSKVSFLEGKQIGQTSIKESFKVTLHGSNVIKSSLSLAHKIYGGITEKP